MTRKLGVNGNLTSEIIKATVHNLLHYTFRGHFSGKAACAGPQADSKA